MLNSVGCYPTDPYGFESAPRFVKLDTDDSSTKFRIWITDSSANKFLNGAGSNEATMADKQ